MSMESAKAFIERVKTDEGFVKEVAKCKDKEERSEFVKSQGFQFTDEELKTQASELTDEELNAISGGLSGYPPNDKCYFFILFK